MLLAHIIYGSHHILLYTLLAYYSLCHLIVNVISFSQSTFNVDEDDGPAQPILVLSNPSSTDITVQVRDTQNTATIVSEVT